MGVTSSELTHALPPAPSKRLGTNNLVRNLDINQGRQKPPMAVLTPARPPLARFVRQQVVEEADGGDEGAQQGGK